MNVRPLRNVVVLFLLASITISTVRTQTTPTPSSETAPTFGIDNAGPFIPEQPINTIQTECEFEGIVYTNGQRFDVGSSGRPNCVKCSCTFGTITCEFVSKKPDGIVTIGCHGTQPCTHLIATARERCVDPQTFACGDQSRNETWYQDGCQYTCTGDGLKVDFVNPVWCQRLSSKANYCLQTCPVDRDEALQRYGDLFTFCKRKEGIVYHHELCDGKFDCDDKTDEENCTTVYCSMQSDIIATKQAVWQRAEVDSVAEISCSSLDSLWTGFLSRKCLKVKNGNHSISSEWERAQLCNCVLKHPSKFNINESVISTPIDVINEAKRLCKYANRSLYYSTFLVPGLKLMKIAIKTDWNTSKSGTFAPFISVITLFLGIPDRLCRTELLDKELEKNLTLSIQNLHAKYGLTWDYRVEKEPDSGTGVSILSGYDIVDLNLDISTLRKKLANQRNLLNGSITSVEQLKNEKVIIKAVTQAVSFAEEKTRILIFEVAAASLSLIAVLVTLATFYILRMPNSTRLLIHKNLVVAYGLFCSFLICGVTSNKEVAKHQIPCAIYMSLFHYFFLACFMWMLLEGIHLIFVLVVVFEMRKRKHGLFMIMGWGLPLLILGILNAIDHSAFIESKSCLNLGRKVRLIRVPSITIIAINFILGALVVFTIAKQQMKKSAEKLDISRSLAKAFLVLSPLLGFFWIFGIFVDTHVVFAYLSSIINGLTGVAFFIFHCLMDKQVQAKAKCSRFSFIRWLSKDTNTMSSKSQNKERNFSKVEKKAHEMGDPQILAESGNTPQRESNV